MTNNLTCSFCGTYVALDDLEVVTDQVGLEKNACHSCLEKLREDNEKIKVCCQFFQTFFLGVVFFLISFSMNLGFLTVFASLLLLAVFFESFNQIPGDDFVRYRG